MTGANIGAAGAAGAYAIIEAAKASGVIVRVEPGQFVDVLLRMEKPLIVMAKGGVFTKHYRYLTSYKGIAFFTKAPKPLPLPEGAEIVAADKIWVPGEF